MAFFNPDGALYDRHTVLPGTVQQNHREELMTQGAAPAALETTSRLVTIPVANGGGAASQLASKQYYSADQRLMVVQRYDYLVGSDTDVGTWEEYRYDALGRRILTRARRDFLNTPDSSRALCNDPVGGSCGSYIQRTLWDGDQLLYEWRVPEAAPTGMTSGSAGYVHLEGIDQPIGLIRPEGTRVINYTWRGLGESSVFTNGNSGDCSMFFTGCTPVQWPGKTQAGVYFTPNLLASGPSGPYTWFGTLAENGGGSTGMLYRRNRYFDPVSGRFTQQDPIGVAGGMNLYGFADGDPVNHSDPFGLSPIGLFAKTVKLAFKRISREQALKGTDDVFVVGRAASGDAKKLAKEKWGNKASRYDAHEEGQLPHYQHRNGGRGHVFYLEKLGTIGVATFGDNIVGQAADFFNPAADALAVYEVYEMAKDEIKKRQGTKQTTKPEDK